MPSVPGTPSGTGTSSSQISLTWGASTAGASCTVSYNLFRSTTSGFTPSTSNLVASGLSSPSFSDTGLTAASTTDYCKIEAADGDGTSAASAQGSGTTTGTGSCTSVSAAPTGLTATASSLSAIGLTWNAVTPPANCSIKSYSVYGGTTANPTTLIASGVTGTSYSSTGLAASTTYYYVVKAVDADGTSAASAQVQATTLANASCTTVPSAPTGLTATASSSSAIGLSWTAVTPPANCTISSYSVYGSTTSGFTPGSGNLIASGLTGTSYSDTGLSASTTYYFVVEAVDADGTSAASTQQSATTQAPSGTEIVAIAAGPVSSKQRKRR